MLWWRPLWKDGLVHPVTMSPTVQPQMRAFGRGARLWRVTVMFDAAGGPSDPEELTGRLRAQLAAASGEPESFDVRAGACWDMIPPGGALGADIWVRADSVGDAADLALDVVEREVRAVAGDRPLLWDVRVIPREAITLASEPGELDRPPS